MNDQELSKYLNLLQENPRDERIFSEIESALSTPSTESSIEEIHQSIDLHERRGEWLTAAKLLEIRAANAQSRPEDQIKDWLRAAQIHHQKRFDFKSAVSAYKQILALEKDHGLAEQGLEEIATLKNDWKSLVENLNPKKSDKKKKAKKRAEDQLQRAVLIWNFDKQNVEQVEKALLQTLQLNSDHVLATFFYADVLTKTSQWSKASQVLTNAFEHVKDASLKLGFAIAALEAWLAAGDQERAAKVSLFVLEKLPSHALATQVIAEKEASESNWEAAAEWFQKALSHEPDSLPSSHRSLLFHGATEILKRGRKWNALIEAFGDWQASLPEEDTQKQIEILSELAEVYRDKLQLKSKIFSTYQQILKLDPGNQIALQSLAQVFEDSNKPRELVKILSQQAASEKDNSKAVVIWEKVAVLWHDDLSNPSKATEAYEQIIQLNPSHQASFEKLRALYEQRRSWKPLVSLLKGAVEVEQDPGRAFELKKELANLCSDKVHDHKTALNLWKEIAEQDPESNEAQEKIQTLAEKEKDWPALAQVLEKKVASEEDEAAQAKLLTKLGKVYSSKLEDGESAAKVWQRLVTLHPDDKRARRELDNAYIALEDWTSLEQLYQQSDDLKGYANMLSRIADKAEVAEKRKALSFLAVSAWEEKAEQPHRAARDLERILEIDPQNSEASSKIIDLFKEGPSWPLLAKGLEIFLTSQNQDDDGQQNVELKALFLHRAALLCHVLLERMEEPSQAFDWAKVLFTQDASHPEVHTLLERSAEASNQSDQLMAFYQSRLPQSPLPMQFELRRKMASIADAQLDDPETAVRLFETNLEQDPTDEESQRALDGLYRSLNRHEDLKSLHELQLSQASESSVQCSLLMEIAKTEEENLANDEGAIQRLQEVLGVDPTHLDALSALCRLAKRQKQWSLLAEVLGKQAELEEDSEKVDALKIREAKLFIEHLKRPEEAYSILQKSLETFAENKKAVTALEQLSKKYAEVSEKTDKILEPIFESQAQYEGLANLLQRKIRREENEQRRFETRKRLAQIFDGALNSPEQAFEQLEAAFMDKPEAEELWDSLEDYAQKSGSLEQVAEAFFTSAEYSEHLGESHRAQLLLRAAKLQLGPLENESLAVEMLEKALLFAPESEEIFSQLEAYHSKAQDWESFERLFQWRIDQAESNASKAELYCRLARGFLGSVEEDAESSAEPPHGDQNTIAEKETLAVNAFVHALDLEPAMQEPFEALKNIYANRQEWLLLETLLQNRISAANDHELVALHFELGEICFRHLQKEQEALDHFESALSFEPAHSSTMALLHEVLEQPEPKIRSRAGRILIQPLEELGDWKGLRNVLSVLANAEPLPELQAQFLQRVSTLEEAQLDDPSAAFVALQKSILLAPSLEAESVFENFARLAEQTEQTQNWKDTLLEALPALETFPSLQAKVNFSLGEHELLHDQKEKACSFLQNVVHQEEAESEIRLKAARLLVDHFQDDVEPSHFVLPLSMLAEFEESESARAGFYYSLGIVFEKTKQENEAIEAYQNCLVADPVHSDALFALCRLYRASEAWDEAIESLRRWFEVVESSADKKSALIQVAEIFDVRMNDSANAIETYQEIISVFGEDKAVLLQLKSLYGKTEQWEELAQVLGRLVEVANAPDEKHGFAFELAECFRVRMQELEPAFETLASILAEDANHEASLDLLRQITFSRNDERLRAAGVLAHLFKTTQQFESLLEILEVLLESDALREKAEYAKQGMEVSEIGLEDASKAFDWSGRLLRFVAKQDVPHAEEFAFSFEAFKRLGAQVSQWDSYISVLKDASQEAMDESIQISLWIELAQTIEREYPTGDDPVSVYQSILEVDPSHVPALNALDRLFNRLDKPNERIEILLRKVELQENATQRSQLFKEIAALRNAGGDVAGAIADFEQALSENDQDEDLFTQLAQLYESQEQWLELEDLYRKQLELGHGNRSAILLNQAEIFAHRLEEPAQAVECCKELLEQNQGEIEGAIVLLEHILHQSTDAGWDASEVLLSFYQLQMQWPQLIGVFERRVEIADAPDAQKEALHHIGQIYLEQLSNSKNAFNAYAKLFELDPEDPENWDVLFGLARKNEGWAELAQLWSHAIDQGPLEDSTAWQLSLKLASVYSSQLQEKASAIRYYQKVLSLEPAQHDAFIALEQLYTDNEDWVALHDLYKNFLDQLNEEEQTVPLFIKLAEVQVEKLQHFEDAEQSYQEVLLIAPEHSSVQTSLHALLSRQEKWAELADHLRFCSEHSASEQESLNHLQNLGEVLLDKSKQPDDAIDVFEEILARDSQQPATVRSLEQLLSDAQNKLRVAKILEGIYQSENDWQKLIVGLQAQIDSLHDEPEEQSRLHQQIAQLYEQQERNWEKAFEHRAEALVRDPLDEANAEELRALTERLFAWQKKIEVNRRVIEQVEDEAVTEGFYSEIAELQFNQLGDLKAASETFQQILDAGYVEGNYGTKLEDCFLLLSDWASLSKCLVSNASREDEAEIRAQKLSLAAHVFEEELGQPKRAVELHNQILEEEPEYLNSLHALRRLYRQDEQWNGLIEILERLTLLGLSEEERHQVLFEMGDLKQNITHDFEGAFEAYREIAETNADDVDVQTKLIELLEQSTIMQDVDTFLEGFYREHGRFSDWVTLLERRVDHVSSGVEKADLYQEVARILSENLGEHTAALGALKKAVAFNVEDDSLLGELEALAEKHGLWAELHGWVEFLVQEAPRRNDSSFDEQRQFEVLLRASDWYVQKLNDVEQAISVLRQAMGVLKQESVVHERLIDLLRKHQPSSEVLVEALLATQDADFSDEDKQGFLKEAVKISQDTLNDSPRALVALNCLLELDPDSVETLEQLAQLYLQKGSQSEIEKTFSKWIEVEPDPQRRKEARLKLAEYFEKNEVAFGKAAVVFEEIFEEDPEDPIASTKLENFYTEKKQWIKLRELFERKLDVLPAHEQLEVRAKLAHLLQNNIKDRGEAISCWRDILDANPGHSEAIENLQSLIALEEDWYGLIDLFEMQVQAASAKNEIDTELMYLEKIANVYRDKIKDTDACLDVLKRMSDKQPDHLSALRAMAKIYETEKDWHQVVDLLSQVWPKADLNEAQSDVLHLVRIFEEQLNDFDRALGVLEQAFGSGIVSPEILIRLSERYVEKEQWEKFIEVQQQSLKLDATVEEQASRCVNMARVQMERIGQKEEAVTFVEKALSLDPHHSDALLLVCELFPMVDRTGEAIEILSDKVQSSARENPKTRAKYFQLLGFLYSQIEQVEKAYENMEQAYKLDVSSVSILRDFGMLAYQMKAFQASQKALRTLLIKRFDPQDLGITKADIYYYLGDMAQQENQSAKAKSLLHKALGEDSNHEQSTLLLNELET